jgi:hypothetical protein
MEKIKDRPQNGPGANSLRGGLRKYNTKTILSNWQEDVGGPQGYKTGFTTEEYISESQLQQLGDRKIPLFGSALPDVETILHPPEAKQIFQPPQGPGSKTWITANQTQQNSIMMHTAETKHSSSDTGCNLPLKDLEEYRTRWTHDNIEGRQIRFVTESKRMTQLADKFKEYVVKLMPGCPEPVSRIRSQLIEKHGAVAFGKLKLALGKRIIHTDELNRILNDLQLVFTRLEFAKILPFFTATHEIPSERIHRVFLANTQGFSDFEQPEYIFGRLFTRERVSLEEIITTMSTSTIPGIVESLIEVLPAYVGWDGNIGVAEFSSLLYDLFSSAPNQYANIIRNIWIGSSR